MSKPLLNWSDDVLDRQEAGKFLYKLVVRRYEAYHSQRGASSLCFAVDADWGAGKSYFVDRWSNDLDAQQHPTVHFDAWANDLSDDPLVGFLAELQKELKPWLNERPVAENVKREMRSKLSELIKQAGKAALPTMKVVGSGLVKRYAGVAVDALEEAWNGEGDEPGQNGPQKFAATTPLSEKDVSSAVEKFLELTLKAHTDRQQAVAKLRANLEDLVEYLAKNAKINVPLFVFIDELDRCRPDYAIRLLEGIKHLFNARGVCFVVSTNLKQLSSAIKAVYGQEFNAYKYLKKFFNFEYTLPAPNNESYAHLLVSGSMLVKSAVAGQILPISCMPPGFIKHDPRNHEAVIAATFAAVATAMDLNLRSQKQIFEHMENSMVALPERTVFPIAYVVFLAALYHNGLDQFEKIFDSAGLPIDVPLKEFITRDTSIDYQQNGQNQTATVAGILQSMHQFAGMRYGEVIERINHRDLGYPYITLRDLSSNVASLPSGRRILMALYGLLIRNSGFVAIG